MGGLVWERGGLICARVCARAHACLIRARLRVPDLRTCAQSLWLTHRRCTLVPRLCVCTRGPDPCTNAPDQAGEGGNVHVPDPGTCVRLSHVGLVSARVLDPPLSQPCTCVHAHTRSLAHACANTCARSCMWRGGVCGRAGLTETCVRGTCPRLTHVLPPPSPHAHLVPRTIEGAPDPRAPLSVCPPPPRCRSPHWGSPRAPAGTRRPPQGAPRAHRPPHRSPPPSRHPPPHRAPTPPRVSGPPLTVSPMLLPPPPPPTPRVPTHGVELTLTPSRGGCSRGKTEARVGVRGLGGLCGGRGCAL